MEKIVIDSEFVDVKLVGGKIVLEIAAVALLKPALEKLKAKIPGQIDDAIIERIVKELE